MKQFMQLQPRKWQAIRSLYFQFDAQTPEERLAAVEQYLLTNGGFDPQKEEDKQKVRYIASSLITSFSSPEFNDSFIETDDNPEVSEARLTIQDIKELKARLLHESSPEIRRLLVAYAVYARANPHPSFWIKSDKKVINFLASLQKLKVSEQIFLTNQLHIMYNLDMQVVGSKQPIPCFRISWLANQPDEDTNPLVLIGPLNPATVKSFAEEIPFKQKEAE